MANRYWVNGSGTWNNSSTTHWSASSGGSSGASVPGSSDTAIFDANSGPPGVVTVDANMTAVQGVNSTNGDISYFSGNTIKIVSGGSVVLGADLRLSGLSIAAGESTTLTSNGGNCGDLLLSGALTCTDGCAFDVIVLDTNAALVLAAGTTSSISGASSVDFPSSLGSASLTSSSSGTQATLSDAYGTNTIDYIAVKDIAFAGGATWVWGSGYVDNGNNTGITGGATGSASAILFGDVA